MKKPHKVAPKSKGSYTMGTKPKAKKAAPKKKMTRAENDAARQKMLAEYRNKGKTKPKVKPVTPKPKAKKKVTSDVTAKTAMKRVKYRMGNSRIDRAVARAQGKK